MATKIQFEMGLDGTGFRRGLDSARNSLNGLKGMIAGAFSVGAVTALARKTIEYAGHINDLSDRLGVTTDYLQEMQFVMKQSGGSVDDLTTTFEKLGAARMAALGGDVKAQQNFAKLGVSMGDLQTKGTSGIVDQIAGTFKQLGNNDAIKTAFKEVGGKGAGALVPAFISGLKEGRKQAKAAGAVMSAETIMQLDEIGDKFDQIALQLMTGIAPSILTFADAIQYLADHLEQSQGALGEFLGNILGAASVSDLKQADERAKKFKDQIDRRVAAGELTPEEGRKKLQQGLSAADISKLDIMDGVGEKVAEIAKRQDGTKAAAAAALAARIAARGKDTTATNATPQALPLVKAISGKSDSLVSVGNFLGSSRSTLESIAQKQLKKLEDIERAINKKGDNTIEVPA